MTKTYQHFAVDRSAKSAWRVKFNNPPINLLDNETVFDLTDFITEINSDENVKVVVFESANDDYFIAHYDVSSAGDPPKPGRPEGPPQWTNFVTRLSQSPVLSVASIRGRARGVGAEFVLACDVRFASAEKAILGQPEVGLGLIPGGGASERLPLLLGRARAIEIILGCEDFNGKLAAEYGWVNRALPDAELDAFVDRFVARVSSFDRPVLRAAKKLLNRNGLPSATQTHDAAELFFEMVNWPGTQAVLGKAFPAGFNVEGDFELNMGDAVAKL